MSANHDPSKTPIPAPGASRRARRPAASRAAFAGLALLGLSAGAVWAAEKPADKPPETSTEAGAAGSGPATPHARRVVVVTRDGAGDVVLATPPAPPPLPDLPPLPDDPAFPFDRCLGAAGAVLGVPGPGAEGKARALAVKAWGVVPRRSVPSAGARDDAPLTVEDARAWLKDVLARNGNPRLRAGAFKDKDARVIEAVIETVDGSLVQKLEIDKVWGLVRRID